MQLRSRQFIILFGLIFVIAIASYLTYKYQLFADSPTPGTPTALSTRAANDDVILNWSQGPGRIPYTYIVYSSTSRDGTYKRVHQRRLRNSDYRDVDALKTTPTLWYRVTAARKDGRKLIESAATQPIQVSMTKTSPTPSPSTSPTTSPSPVTINGPTLYVGTDGTDIGNDCTDPARRCRQIRHALTQAKAGTGTTISIGDNAIYDGFSLRNFGVSLPDTVAQTSPLTLRGEGKNITILPNGRDTITIYGEKVKGLVLDNIKIENTGRNNVRIIDSSFITIKNSEFYRGDSACILLVRTHNVTIDNVIAAKSEEHHGVYISDNSSNITIKNSTIYENGAAGIQVNAEKLPGDTTNAVAKNITIEKNVIYNNGWTGGAALNLLGMQDATIQDNFIYNNYAGGIAAVWADQGTPSSLRPVGGPKNVKILNNTIIMAASNPRRNTVAVRYAVSFIDSFGLNELRDNVIYHPEGKALSFGNQIKADTANLASNNNTYKNGSHVSLYDGSKKFALTDWQQNSLTWSGSNNQRNSEHDQDSDIIATTTDILSPTISAVPAAGSLTANALESYLKQ
jgi:hypothetical protein